MSMQEYIREPFLGSYKQLSGGRRYLSDVPLLASSWSLMMALPCAAISQLDCSRLLIAQVTVDLRHFLLALKHALQTA